MGRVVAGLTALAVALCLATGALAHASLVSADPADGSTVASAPRTVQLQFNESVAPAAVNLIDASGKSRNVTARSVDRSVVIVLPEDLPAGTQVVSYRVVSQDGHPVAGSLVFSIGAATGGIATSAGGPIAFLIWLSRIGVYLGLFAGVGGVFFAAWIGQGPAGARVITGSLAIGLASAIASLGLQGIELLDLPLTGLFSAAPWKSALGTSLGPSLSIAIASMLVARVAWRSPTMTIAWVLTTLAMVGAGLSLATSGHAATASPRWLTGPAMFVHGVTIAFWVGALAPLLALSRQGTGAVLQPLLRFSRLAVPVVGALALSGLTLAVVQLEGFGALVGTRYGVILLVKLILVTILLAIAALNRFMSTPELKADPSDAKTLKGGVLLECVVVLLIFGVVAGWRFTPPPRALAAAVRAPLAIHVHTDQAMAQVSISPGKVGSDDIVVQLLTGDFGPLSAREATVTLSLPSRGIEPIERSASMGPDGGWHVRGVPLPQPGRWHLRIEALVTDFQKVTLETDFELK